MKLGLLRNVIHSLEDGTSDLQYKLNDVLLVTAFVCAPLSVPAVLTPQCIVDAFAALQSANLIVARVSVLAEVVKKSLLRLEVFLALICLCITFVTCRVTWVMPFALTLVLLRIFLGLLATLEAVARSHCVTLVLD